MERAEFEQLRDLTGKTIDVDIVLKQKRERRSVYAMEDIQVNNNLGHDVRLKVEWIEPTDAKCINVIIKGLGPICRFDIDGNPHAPYGRNHKHSLKLVDCPSPEINLGRDVCNRDDLSGLSIKELFTEFCKATNIVHNGSFINQGANDD